MSTGARGYEAGARRVNSVSPVYTVIYPLDMPERAKIFNNGGSQAVRLPKSCQFPDDQREVVARRVGRKVILEPVDEWSPDFLQMLGTLSEEIERPESPPVAKKKDPFG